jgi:hypothetical protein
MTIKAWLEGQQFDLQDLAELLAEGHVRVVHDDAEDAYYLTAPEIDNPPAGSEFYDVAQRLLIHINGIGRVSKADFQPVQLTGKYGTPSGGQHVVAAALLSEIRLHAHAAGVVTGTDGQPVPPEPSPWPERLMLADTNEHVARALKLMNSAEPLQWAELYKVHEIIRRDVKPKKFDEIGWTTKARDRAFGASADRYDVSGDAARHAVDKHAEPPKETMTISEGRSYISDLVAKWLDSLANP